MKNFFKMLCILAVLCIAVPQSSKAASPRNVLLEAFTNAGCSPCALLYPTWDAAVKLNSRYIPIKFHVNWPGTDPMYNINAANSSARCTYYSVTGVPTYVVNGTVADGSDTTKNYYDPTENFNQIKDQTSPITLTIDQVITGQTIEAKVKVQTDDALMGKVLRIAVVQYMVEYEGANGEDEHYWVVRNLLPNAGGTALNIAAGGSQDIDLSYTAPVAVKAQNTYIVAFVQDDASKEILQAGSNFDTRKAVPEVTTTAALYEPIGRNTTIYKKFTVTNKGNYAETFSISPAIYSVVENPSTVTFDKESVTLEPNASEDVTMTIESGSSPFFASIGAVIAPTSTDKIIISDEVSFRIMTNDAKYCIIYGTGNSSAFTYSAMLANSQYKEDVVAVPFYQDFFAEFPPTGYADLLIAAFDDTYSQVLASMSQGTQFLNAVNDMLNAGKKVMINANRPLYFSTILPTARDFFKERLNVSIESSQTLQHCELNQQGYITAINTFVLNGASGDAIGGSIGSVKCNDYNANSYPYYNALNDALSCDASQTIVPFCYYDGDASLTAGIRATYEKGKLAYMSFGFDAIKAESVRNTIQNTVIDWLLNSVPDIPMLALDNDYYDFGDVAIGTQKTCDITISNQGAADLVINNIDLTGSSDFAFSGEHSLPITLGYGDSYTMTMIYSPTKKTEVYANVDIASNAPLSPDASFSLSGTGVSVDDQPIAQISATSINFDSVEVLKAKDITIKIKNTGKAALTVEGVSFSKNNPAVFEVIEGYDTPYILESGDEENITVEFQPYNPLIYSGVLDIQTNDPNNELIQVDLSGIGFEGSSVRDVAYSKDHNFELKVLPNPLASNGKVQFTVFNNPADIQLSLVDMSGRTVETIYSAQTVSGTQNIALDLSRYSNGYYSLVADVDGEKVVLSVIISK